MIDDEFLADLEVRFPSAPAGTAGPIRAELLYEDPGATWRSSPCGAACRRSRWRRSYRFLKGEDVTVIGNPGLGDEVVLENAISRGVMSSQDVDRRP